MQRDINPPRKQKTREEAEKMREKAVRFLRDVVGDEDKAEEFQDMSTQEYAEHKRIQLVNPARRREIVEHALKALPFHATSEDRVNALKQARVVVLRLGPEATELDVLQAASEAIAAVVLDCNRCHRKQSWLSRLGRFLPFGASEEEEAESHTAVSALLDSLPISVPDSEVEEEIRRKLRPLTKRIELRERKKDLVRYGRNCIDATLAKLYNEGQVEKDERYDPELASDLAEAVEETLDDELSGDEEYDEVQARVSEIVEDELDI